MACEWAVDVVDDDVHVAEGGEVGFCYIVSDGDALVESERVQFEFVARCAYDSFGS